MRFLIILPIAITIILAFVVQLSDIAISTSDKALNYSNEMDNAVDCAFRGIPIEKCSPNLNSKNFEPEINEIIDFNQILIREYGLNISEIENQIKKKYNIE